MNDAVIGLIGVLVGSVITGSWQYGLAFRKDRRERRAASRLVADELRSIHQDLWAPAILDQALHLLGKLTVERRAWQDYRGVLAAELSPADWVMVATAYENVKSALSFSAIDFKEMPDKDSRAEMRKALGRVAGTICDAIELLERSEPQSHRRRLMDIPDPLLSGDEGS